MIEQVGARESKRPREAMNLRQREREREEVRAGGVDGERESERYEGRKRGWEASTERGGEGLGRDRDKETGRKVEVKSLRIYVPSSASKLTLPLVHSFHPLTCSV